MAKTQTKPHKLNLWKGLLDAVMTIGFLLLMEPRATGLSVHEWGGLAIAFFFIVHKALNWNWIKAVSTSFFKKGVPGTVRLNYVVDVLLLLGFGLIIVSGMAIAKTLDFHWLFGTAGGGFWRGAHLVASLLILVAVGIHLGLHWNWIRARIAGKKAASAGTQAVSHG